MTTDLIVGLIVLAATILAAFIGYWSGHDAGYREANARARAKASRRHPSGGSVRIIDAPRLQAVPDDAS